MKILTRVKGLHTIENVLYYQVSRELLVFLKRNIVPLQTAEGPGVDQSFGQVYNTIISP